MEESSNGGLEETMKVEEHDEVKEVVLEDASALKAEVDDGKDSSSSSSSWDKEAEPDKEKNPPNQGENLEKIEDEKVVSDSVEVERDVSLIEEFSKETEPSVEKSEDSDDAELESKETEEKISASLDETNKDSPVLTDVPINGLKEYSQRLSSDVESKVIDEETTPPCLDQTNASAVAVDVVSNGIEESTISSLSENVEVLAAAVEQAITEREVPVSDNSGDGSLGSGPPDLASKNHVEDSFRAENALVETRDAGELVNKSEIPESKGNQPIISLNHRPEQPTSWRSCCGLFEVLRRSNR